MDYSFLEARHDVRIDPTSVDATDLRRRIAWVLDSAHQSRHGSHQLFDYLWSMICVESGLLKVVGSDQGIAGSVILEEARSGNQRVIRRPHGLDPEVENLGIQALRRILTHRHRAG